MLYLNNCTLTLNKKGMLDKTSYRTSTRVTHFSPFLLNIIYFIKIKYTK